MCSQRYIAGREETMIARDVNTIAMGSELRLIKCLHCALSSP